MSRGIFLLLFLQLITSIAYAQPIPNLDYGCAALSYRINGSKLLVTDRGGRIFSGSLDHPFLQQIAGAGKALQARFVAQGSRILIAYRSGSIELLDAENFDEVIDSLPSYSYMSLEVSSDGAWGVGLTPGGSSVEVLNFDSGRIEKRFSYEHPLGSKFRIGNISTKHKIAALIDEKSNIYTLDMRKGIVTSIEQPGAEGEVLEVSFIEDQIWITRDGGLMPTGATEPLPGHKRRAIQGMSILQSRLLAIGDSNYFIAADDLGFSQVKEKKDTGAEIQLETVGKLRIVPGLVDTVVDPTKDRIALCGSALEVSLLQTGETTLMERPRTRSLVYVENVTAGRTHSIVRDMKGRAAIWSNSDNQFVAALPRLPLQVFPAFSALHEPSRTYLSMGQRDVLSIARLDHRKAQGESSYLTEAIALPLTENAGEFVNNNIVIGRSGLNEAFIVRPDNVLRVEWSNRLALRPDVKKFIPPGTKTCLSFMGAPTLSPSGRYMAIACKEGIAIFELSSRERIALITPPKWKEQGEQIRVWAPSLSFSQDESYLAIAVRVHRTYVVDEVDQALASKSPSVYLFDTRKKTLSALSSSFLPTITAVAVARDNRYIWIGGYFGTVTVIDRVTEKVVKKVRGLTGTVFGINIDDEGGASIWTDAGDIVQVSASPEFSVTAHSTFVEGARVRRKVSNQSSQKPSRGNAPSLIKVVPENFLSTFPTPSKLRLELSVPDSFNNPVEVVLYENKDVVSRGKSVFGNTPGSLIATFEIRGTLTGEISVGLYAGAGEMNQTIDVGPISEHVDPSKNRIIGAFVGIGTFDHKSIPRLPLAAGDAQALSDAFRGTNSDLNVFPNNQAATKKNVLQFITEVQEKAGPSDTLLIHLSGHGMVSKNGNEFIFATKDTDLVDGYAVSGVTASALLDIVAKGRQGSTLLILDTCSSSAFIEKILQDERMSEGPLSLGKDGRGLSDSVGVIAAASKVSVAKEGYKGRGLLTGVIIESLATPLVKDSSKWTQFNLMKNVELRLGYTSRLAFPTNQQEPILHYASRDFVVKQLDLSK